MRPIEFKAYIVYTKLAHNPLFTCYSDFNSKAYVTVIVTDMYHNCHRRWADFLIFITFQFNQCWRMYGGHPNKYIFRHQAFSRGQEHHFKAL